MKFFYQLFDRFHRPPADHVSHSSQSTPSSNTISEAAAPGTGTTDVEHQGSDRSLEPQNALSDSDVNARADTTAGHGQEAELDRFTTATSKTPQSSKRPSTEPKRSILSLRSSRSLSIRETTSRGLAVLQAVFRYHRSQPRHSASLEDDQLAKGRPAADREHTVEVHADLEVRSTVTTTSITGAAEARKVSDHTISTNTTEDSAPTVHRHPSRHVTSPIATVQQHMVPSVSELQEMAQQSMSFELNRSDLQIHYPRPPSSEYSDHPGFRNISAATRSTDTSGYLPLDLWNLSSDMISQRLFSDMRPPTRQHMATRKFNNLAAHHKCPPLVVDQDINSVTVDSGLPSERRSNRRDNLLRKIHSMRSTFNMRHKSRSGPALRRIKTLTSLSSRYHTMNSLNGRSLETLARLGGCSVLTLPADFAPASMRLPSCIVATISYLRTHAPNSRNVFFDSGDLRVAARIYDHFADQVLPLEQEAGKIDITMRGSGFPSRAVGLGSESEEFLRGRFHVLSVACVFKQLLAGLPGGILGSRSLYRNLVNISQPPWTGPGGSHTDRAGETTKQRAIALAITALTSDMQLDLICAVFGLCAILLDEAERMIEYHRRKKIPAIGLAGILDSGRLSHVFGPLLLGPGATTAVAGVQEDVESEAFRVAKMMITNWRGVSRQLRLLDV